MQRLPVHWCNICPCVHIALFVHCVLTHSSRRWQILHWFVMIEWFVRHYSDSTRLYWTRIHILIFCVWCNICPCIGATVYPCILVQLLHVQACYCSIVTAVCRHTWFWSGLMRITVGMLRRVYCELVTTSTSISTFDLPLFWDGAKFARASLIWDIYTQRVVARTLDDILLNTSS